MADITSYPAGNAASNTQLIGTQMNVPQSDGTNKNLTRNFSISNLAPLITQYNLGYTVYTALITQTGTDAPVATVLQNTTGGTIAWSYSNVGIYVATISDATYTANKTAVLISSGGVSNSTVKSSVVNSTTALTVYQVDVGDQQPTNTISATTTLEIRIYS